MNCLILALICIFSHSLYAMAEKFIVVVIPSYNNEQWVERNIASAISQQYRNFKVIYINDCSTDTTGAKATAFIEQHDIENRIVYYENPINMGALKNIWCAVHSSPDDAIIITLDGDDWFAHDKVLERINREYSTKDIWMSWGQYKTSTNNIGCCRSIPRHIIEQKQVRNYMWCMSHPRTFYAKLFKLINLEDLMYEGEFMDVCWDLAMMFPMLEMAQEKSAFIPDILYIYNTQNPINDNKIKSNRIKILDSYVKRLPSYKPLEELF